MLNKIRTWLKGPCCPCVRSELVFLLKRQVVRVEERVWPRALSPWTAQPTGAGQHRGVGSNTGQYCVQVHENEKIAAVHMNGDAGPIEVE